MSMYGLCQFSAIVGALDCSGSISVRLGNNNRRGLKGFDVLVSQEVDL